MNTVDPNEKVAQVPPPQDSHADSHEMTATSPVVASNDAPQPAKCDANDSAKNAPLPNYHHHRSTALW